MHDPRDPIAAATASNPYAIYAAVVAEAPIARDPASGMWVAAGAQAVSAILGDQRCRVRPPGEPVPTALAGSPVGDVFRHLVRMTDGAVHAPLKRSVSAALASIDERDLARTSERWARELWDANDLDRFIFALPSYVIADLLGIPDGLLPRSADLLGRFVRCLAPGNSPKEIEQGNRATRELCGMMHALLDEPDAPPTPNLFLALAREARREGIEDAGVIVANAIGFLVQAHDATAGLIGNTLLALASRPELRAHARVGPDMLNAVIASVARENPSVQNTRRYVAEEGIIAGAHMQVGDAILVLLAAANHDPAGVADPGQPGGADCNRPGFSFGAGVHACPGAALALTIARAGIEHIIADEAGDWQWPRVIAYRPSRNARIPRFTEEEW